MKIEVINLIWYNIIDIHLSEEDKAIVVRLNKEITGNEIKKDLPLIMEKINSLRGYHEPKQIRKRPAFIKNLRNYIKSLDQKLEAMKKGQNITDLEVVSFIYDLDDEDEKDNCKNLANEDRKRANNFRTFRNRLKKQR